MSGSSKLGLIPRIGLLLFGLILMGFVRRGSPGTWVVWLFGAVVFLAAIGGVELGMLLWYRALRRLRTR